MFCCSQIMLLWFLHHSKSSCESSDRQKRWLFTWLTSNKLSTLISSKDSFPVLNIDINSPLCHPEGLDQNHPPTTFPTNEDVFLIFLQKSHCFDINIINIVLNVLLEKFFQSFFTFFFDTIVWKLAKVSISFQLCNLNRMK